MVEGVTFQLRDVGQGVIEVKKDNDRVIQAVKSMVQQFNSTYGFINEKMGEGALLQGDQMMLRLQNSLRRVFMDPVAGSSLGSVGISISKEGIMSLDEAKLKKAPEEDHGGLTLGQQGWCYPGPGVFKTYTKQTAWKSRRYGGGSGPRAENGGLQRMNFVGLERRVEPWRLLCPLLSQQDWLTSQLTAHSISAQRT